jgi:hypothetical protein
VADLTENTKAVVDGGCGISAQHTQAAPIEKTAIQLNSPRITIVNPSILMEAVLRMGCGGRRLRPALCWLTTAQNIRLKRTSKTKTTRTWGAWERD